VGTVGPVSVAIHAVTITLVQLSTTQKLLLYFN
jgi:hypothetical protein